MEPKQKQCPVVDVNDDGSKVWCCKEQYCVGTWNVRCMNQGKFSSVQSISCVQLFATPWITAHQASLSITNSQSMLKLMSMSWMAWVGDAIQLSHLLSSPSTLPSIFPASGSFPMSQFYKSGGQSIGASASASVLSMNIQDWVPLGLTSWISQQSKGLSRVFSNTTVQKHQFFGAQLSL